MAGPDRASRRVPGRRSATRARRLFALMPRGDHVPVLLQEAVAALAVKPDGTYLDGTFGRGGHARRILDTLGPHGRLVALDRDPSAEAAAREWTDPRFHFHRAWFSGLRDVLAHEHIDRI